MSQLRLLLLLLCLLCPSVTVAQQGGPNINGVQYSPSFKYQGGVFDLSLPTVQNNIGASQVPQQNPGIVCDGVTDNQLAIQAAINVLEANSVNGGVVNLPACNNIGHSAEFHINKSGIFILGSGGTALPALSTASSWCGAASPTPAPTVLCYIGTGANQVRFEPDAGGKAITGGGMKNIVLAGKGAALENLVIKTMRGGVFDRVVAENCTTTCIELNVTSNVLASREFCDTQSNEFYGLTVYINTAETSSASANGLLLDGLTDTSTPADGCSAFGEAETNSSFNHFYDTYVVVKNGTGIILNEAVDNQFKGYTRITSSGIGFKAGCAQSTGQLPARRDVFDDINSNASIQVVSCNTSFLGPGNDSPQQIWFNLVGLSTGGQKPAFNGNYSPNVSMFWTASDGTTNLSKRAVPYVSSNWYIPSSDIGAISNGSAPGANLIQCRQVEIDAQRPWGLSQGGVRVSTADAAGHVQVALYNKDGVGGGPGTLIDATSSIATNGGTQATTFPTVSGFQPMVGAGSYIGMSLWGCFNTDSATAAFSAVGTTYTAGAAIFGAAGITNTLTAPVQGISCSGAACQGGSSTFGTWPASLSTSTWTIVTAGTVPVMLFEAQ